MWKAVVWDRTLIGLEFSTVGTQRIVERELTVQTVDEPKDDRKDGLGPDNWTEYFREQAPKKYRYSEPPNAVMEFTVRVSSMGLAKKSSGRILYSAEGMVKHRKRVYFKFRLRFV